MTQPVLYTGCRVLTPAGIRDDLGVLCAGGRILALPEAANRPAADTVRLPPEALLAPGLIDLQVNGGGGILFNDTPTPEAARAIARAHRRLGTTGILPTLITSPPELLARAAAAFPAALGEGVLGLHVEGPFLSPARPGVHRRDWIRPPTEADLALMEDLAARPGMRLLVTLAPECVGIKATARLKSAGVVLSAGHTEAAFEQVGPEIDAVTHLFNAMPPLTARAPGVAAAALVGERVACVIADLVHVHPAMLRLLFAAKPADRIALVSDAMSVAGTDAPGFELDGRPIFRRNGRLETADGTLAGADLSLAEAVRNLVRALGVPVETAIACASAVPAALMGMTDRGRIAPGCAADMVLFSPALEVLGTVLEGALEAAPGIAT